MAEQIPSPDKIKEEKERIKEEVQAFREQTEGLNPEMFNVPGEKSLAEEEIPDELAFAYELEEKIAEYTKKALLVKNDALKKIESNLDKGQTSQWNAWVATLGFSSLINSPLWSEIDKDEQEKLIKKARLIKDKALKEIESGFDKGQASQDYAWNAIYDLSALINSPLWPEINKKKQEEIIKKAWLVKDNILKAIESNLNKGQINLGNAWIATLSLSSLVNSPIFLGINKDKQKELIRKTWLVKDNALKQIELDLDNDRNIRDAIKGLSSLTILKNYLLKVANQKLKEQEHQKALHPEKDIPPRPEFSSF